MTRFLASRQWWLFTGLILLLGTVWTVGARLPESAPSGARIPSPQEGFFAPNFTLADFSGAPLALDSLRGKVVVLNLWASWCAPCRAEMPMLQKVSQANQARGLVVLGVNSTVQDTEDKAREFAREMNISFPVLLDRDGAVTSRYRVQALPTTFVVDRQGIIRSVVIGGPLAEATLLAKVDPLLAENPSQ